MKVVDNLRADVRDITDTARRIANRHLSSIKGMLRGGFGFRR